MIAINLQIRNEAAIRRWCDNLERNFMDYVERLVKLAGLDAERTAKRLVPVRHNILKSSLRLEVNRYPDRVVARMGTNVHYAPYVEYGTGIHGPRKRRIYPRRAKALSWFQRGRGIYVGGRYQAAGPGGRITVRSIAGMKPRPYMRPALEHGSKKLMADIDRLARLDFPKGGH